MRVLRVYHAGRDSAHRARERALTACGIDVTLGVPHTWPEGGGGSIGDERFRVEELTVARAGDVNRHSYADISALRALLEQVRPDVVDLHEEPFSVAVHQWLQVVPRELPVVVYTAQNVAKRYPPPFGLYERQAYARVAGVYPCSRQAASVVRSKGFTGTVCVIPLGFDPETFREGRQSLEDDELTLAHVGRLVPEKGVLDAVRILARINQSRPARLVIVGSGPEANPARALADSLRVGDRLEVESWRPADELADIYRRAHVVLVPSVATSTWTEQFGRVIIEAQACGAIVAAYASGAIPEVVAGTGVVVAPGDVSALGTALVRLVEEAEGYAEHRSRGLQLAQTRTWDRVAAMQAALYHQVTRQDAQPRPAMPLSPRERRAAATAEFGAAAPLSAGARPFALPLLRRGGVGARALGFVADAAGEARAALLRRRV